MHPHTHTHTYSMNIHDVAAVCLESCHKEEESMIPTGRFSVMNFKYSHIKYNEGVLNTFNLPSRNGQLP